MQESDKRKPVQDVSTPAPDLSPDATLKLDVTRDILSLATRMAAALDIIVPDDKWPTVIVSSSAQTSSYSPSDNTITIFDKHVHDGSAYAEEVTHFLKSITTPAPLNEPLGASNYADYKLLQEVCGRLGRDFAKRICAGTDLERLFASAIPHEGEELSKMARQFASQMEGADLILEKQRDALNKSAALLRELKESVDRILDTEWGSETHLLPQATAFLKEGMSKALGSTATSEGAKKRLQAILDVVTRKDALKGEEVLEVLYDIEKVAVSDENRAFNLSVGSTFEASKALDLKIHGHAYSAAEALMRNDPDTWPEHFKKIMHLSLEEARDPKGGLASI